MPQLDGLLNGFGVALSGTNLLMVLLGVVIGMVIGVLPGLGPTATIAMLLPVTYALEPSGAIILLAGIYYGAMYGGTITAVLVRVPGEVASIVTTFDGYEMARQGRAGTALGTAAIGSFVGGVVATVMLVAIAAPLAALAGKFGPPELFAVALLGLLLVLAIARGSLIKALAMLGLGLLIGTVGQDPVDGVARFTFGSLDLLGGLEVVAIAMGMFGIGEVLHNLHHGSNQKPLAAKTGKVWPSSQDLRASAGPIARGTLIGSVLGLVPGGGSVLSSMTSYAVERRRAKDPTRFGNGAIEGVAGPETANNAGSTASFLPLLTLGLPTGSVMALMFGALLLQGITPGPTLVSEHPDVFWGIMASMFIGNLMLLVLNIPLVGAFVQLLKIRMSVISAVTVMVTMVGVYSLNNSTFDMVVAVVAGLLGYAMRKTSFEPGPLVLSAILGGTLESNLRSSLTMSDGDPTIFVTRPVSLVLCTLFVAVLITGMWLAAKKRQTQAPSSTVARTG
ncbi:putative tricarboxylic transport membrane protein [Saccharopolyspora shandongensis]|uniref:Putative tricarboxylic transport membrane protein n=1 Tax=Saccharopolyspora shandongensis TaxID=418495 RepID=A0A1H3Q3I6_9PSEU|nr:tripartite tricarboxylate transporter permease [Saccharopolyspora shandongensis]SDZ07585.1 putative tricarboxylic transport membrane protein [Saccharopolyspora shandongensis]